MLACEESFQPFGQGWIDVEQPFHIYDSKDGGRSLAHQPIVLARIPHIGTKIGAATESAPVGRAAPVPAAESCPGVFSRGTHFFIDSQHTSTAPTHPESRSQVEPQSPTSSHRRSHMAHSHSRSPESSAVGSPQPIVATGLSHLYEDLASYAGLIVTLVLVASGALLYWMIAAPSEAPIADYSNSFETFGSAEIEIPKFAPATTPSITPPTEHQFASSSEFPALPETPVESASELTRLPEQTSVPSDETGPEFNDASAWNYPATDHPHGLDLAGLRVTDVAGENAVVSPSKPVKR